MFTAKKILLLCAPVGLAAGFLAGGCYENGRAVYYDHDPGPYTVTERRVVVVDPPPADRVEVIQPQRRGYVWVNGHYRHDGRRYTWVNGHYERIPRSNARYRPGYWDRRGNGYVWIDGRWY
jgi:hypothetical protein